MLLVDPHLVGVADDDPSLAPARLGVAGHCQPLRVAHELTAVFGDPVGFDPESEPREQQAPCDRKPEPEDLHGLSMPDPPESMNAGRPGSCATMDRWQVGTSPWPPCSQTSSVTPKRRGVSSSLPADWR